MARRARRCLRREVGLGARQLVSGQRARRRGVAAPARVGGDALVAGDRRRAPRHARARGPVRRVVLLEARDRGPGRSGVPGRAVRQQRGGRARRDHLHADAQPPRRDRVRLHRHARRGGAVLDRHRHRLRQPRPELDPPPRSGRRQRALLGRDRPVGVLRAVGTARARDPRAAHRRSARLPLHAHARSGRRRRSRARAAGDLRGRARLGALLPDGVRRGPVANAVAGRARARPRRGRLPRDRLAAPGEGLPRVGRRHHARGDAPTRRDLASA